MRRWVKRSDPTAMAQGAAHDGCCGSGSHHCTESKVPKFEIEKPNINLSKLTVFLEGEKKMEEISEKERVIE